MSRNGQRNPFESSHRSPDVKAFWASARNDSSSFIRADDETIPDMQTSPLHNGYATKKYDSPKYKFRWGKRHAGVFVWRISAVGSAAGVLPNEMQRRTFKTGINFASHQAFSQTNRSGQRFPSRTAAAKFRPRTLYETFKIPICFHQRQIKIKFHISKYLQSVFFKVGKPLISFLENIW